MADAYPACAHVAGFVDGQLHGKGGYHQPQAAVAVHHAGGRRFVDNLNIRGGIDAFGFPEAYIAAQPGYAVRIYSPQVGRDQCFCRRSGVFFTASYFFEYGGYELEELRIRK